MMSEDAATHPTTNSGASVNLTVAITKQTTPRPVLEKCL